MDIGQKIIIPCFGNSGVCDVTLLSNYTSSLGDKYDIIDDGEGNILVNGDINGQIFYSHGIVAITTGSLQGFGRKIFCILY